MSRSGGRLAIAAAVGLAVLIAYPASERWYRARTSSCVPLLAGNPHRGGQLFSSRGCSACHSLFGTGPAAGPDLGQPLPGGWRPMGAVAAMWSHGPDVWEKLSEARMGMARISELDVLDLFAFISSLQDVDEPGDASKGQELFVSKSCARCHDPGSGKNVGPDLTSSDADTPLLWAQRMWNHSQAMSVAVAKQGIAWPTFNGTEMADLLAYVRGIARGVRREATLLPAHPEKGQQLFASKGCGQCHAIGGRGGGVGPDLGPQHPIPSTMTGLAGLMWNHAPRMVEKIKSQGLVQPKFEEQEMADLVAFFQQVRYLQPQGDADRGKAVFQTKGCATCHGADARGGRAGPDLLSSQRPYCASKVFYVMWSHGPQMYRKMKDAGIAWPAFKEEEMVDLISFLNR
jgi:cytochrome c2